MSKKKKKVGVNKVRITFNHPDGCSSIWFTWDHSLSKRANIKQLAEMCIERSVSVHAANSVCNLFNVSFTTLHNAIRKLQHDH